MKKIVIGACLVGMIALLATSCKKKDEESAKLYSINQELVDEEGEFEGSDGSKIYFTGNRLYFEAGDEVRLFSIDETNVRNSRAARYTPEVGAQVDNNTTWTLVSGEIELPTTGDRYAFCPGDVNHVVIDQTFNDPTDGENRASFILPEELEYREISGAATLPMEGFYMASKLEAGQSTFSFRNICGVLHLKLWSNNSTPRTVGKIVVTDKFKHVSGTVSLIIPNVDPDEMTWLLNNYNESNATYMARLKDYIDASGYSVTNASMSVTLDCGDGVALGTTSGTAKDFYIPLRPLALRKGCTIEVYAPGAEQPFATINSSKNNMIKPNVMKNMSAVNVK